MGVRREGGKKSVLKMFAQNVAERFAYNCHFTGISPATRAFSTTQTLSMMISTTQQMERQQTIRRHKARGMERKMGGQGYERGNFHPFRVSNRLRQIEQL